MKVELKNTTRKLCVIGDPVLHSKSPLIQNAMIGELGLDYIYLCQPVPRGQGGRWLEEAAAGYAGFNATMPFKEELLPLMDQVEPFAQLCGAVNTVCIKDGKYYGYNTDGPGFLMALADLGVDPKGKRAVLLGAGGAAKAVALALGKAGARVSVCNRNAARAEELCQLMPERLLPCEFTIKKLCKQVKEADLLVNCTSLGMEGTGADFEDLSFVEALRLGAAVCDAVYAPLETRLLKTARTRGLRTMNGLGMLVGQAVLALEHFAGAPIDREKAKAAALKALEAE